MRNAAWRNVFRHAAQQQQTRRIFFEKMCAAWRESDCAGVSMPI
jgi:hypothetical protein